MFFFRLRFVPLLGLAFCALAPIAQGRDLKITVPKRSELTPVQRLNREGVDALGKHDYEKAEALFYKAYLYDPADPFTLNNLGYISELQGQLERAATFYKLATEQSCDAVIDRSSAKRLEGKPMMFALDTLKNIPMRVNRINIEAMELLSQEQGFEAESLLKQALAVDPRNPFTLNNLGVAEESLGDYDAALQYYDAAAASHSMEPIVVTLKRSWRGKPVSEMAADSARNLRQRMRHMDLARARATMFALRGVEAVNQNDWSAAKQDFLNSYSLDPSSAFTLNNLGYISEKNGDLETAKFYYAKSRRAADAGARVGLASMPSAEGEHLSTVAATSDRQVQGELAAYTQMQREQTGPVELIPRGDHAAEPGVQPTVPSSPTQQQPSQTTPPPNSQPQQ